MLVEAKKELALFSPVADRCQQCAVSHREGEPHDQDSPFWHTWFMKHHGRWPTWTDALAHCDSETRQRWCQGMVKKMRDDKVNVPQELLEGLRG